VLPSDEDAYEPAEQAIHACVVPFENVPTLQARQPPYSSDWKYPARHTSQEVEPSIVLVVPNGHGVQKCAVADAWYVPVMQGTHVDPV